MPIPDEFQLQRAYIMWARGVPGKIVPALKPGVICWHTPNGGHRDPVEAKRLKESGVLPGFPDVAHLYGGLFLLEFKHPNGKGRLSPAQLDLHPRLVAAGAVVETVDNLQAAKDFARRNQLTVC